MTEENKTELGALYYPTKDQFGNDIPFDTLFIPYIYREIYFENVYDILTNRKDLTIIDVGANIGVTVDYFRRFAKTIYAVEPSPENFAALKKNHDVNKWDNVRLLNYALADRNGEMDFAESPKNRTTNAIQQPEKYQSSKEWYGETFKVPTKTIDTMFAEEDIEHVDFMKFDPEGSEEMILYSEGFRKVAPKIDAIECEFHHPDWMNIVRYLESLGYTARRYESSAIIVLFTR